MKQTILPFCLVLVLLGVAYLSKNQWAHQSASPSTAEEKAVSVPKGEDLIPAEHPVSGGGTQSPKSVESPKSVGKIKRLEYGMVSLASQKPSRENMSNQLWM